MREGRDRATETRIKTRDSDEKGAKRDETEDECSVDALGFMPKELEGTFEIVKAERSEKSIEILKTLSAHFVKNSISPMCRRYCPTEKHPFKPLITQDMRSLPMNTNGLMYRKREWKN